MNHIGLNILAQYVNQTTTQDYLLRLQPASIVVMDAPEWAERLASLLPRTLVIHRAWNVNDAQWHITDVSPEQYVNRLPRLRNVIHQLYNEPNSYDADTRRAVVAYCVRAMEIASAQGIRLALPNWAVGHPPEDDDALRDLDPLIQAFIRYPQHAYTVHEYFNSNGTVEPYHVGRYTSVARRLPRTVQVVVTEYGRDLGGGELDGWTQQGWTPTQYANKLIAPVSAGIYDGVPLCVFSWGKGAGGRWRTFDISGENDVQSKLLSVPYRGKATPVMDWGTAQRERIKSFATPTTTFINVRSEPNTSAPVVGRLEVGSSALVYANKQNSSAYQWAKIDIAGLIGYVAYNLAVWESVSAPPPPPPPIDDALVSVVMTVDEAQQAATLHTQIAAATRTVVDLHVKLAEVMQKAVDRHNNRLPTS